MKLGGNELEKKAKDALRSCLSRVPFLKKADIKRQDSGGEMKPDFLIKLALSEGEQYLVVEVKANGQPRLAREAINQLLRYRDLFPNAYGIFLAPYITPRAGELCKKEEIGYLDLAGNCYLCFDSVYIEQEGRPNVYKEKRDLRSLYSPRAERVLRVLLNGPGKAWKVADLAEEAQVSLGQVSNVKKLLMDREWIRVGSTGFELSEPEQLLKEWEENYTFRRNRVLDFYSMKGPARTEADLAVYCSRKKFRYALTGFSGAARSGPAVRYQRVMAYLAYFNEDIGSELALQKVDSGANVSLFIPYDEGVFYGSRELGGAQVASPVQVYLDVRSFRGRGEEAAQVLFDQVIKPSW